MSTWRCRRQAAGRPCPPLRPGVCAYWALADKAKKLPRFAGQRGPVRVELNRRLPEIKKILPGLAPGMPQVSAQWISDHASAWPQISRAIEIINASRAMTVNWTGEAPAPPGARRKIPGHGRQNGVPAADTVIHVHYFAAFGDWWISELWQQPGGRWAAYGYARLEAMPEGAEWGRVDLDELEQLCAHAGLTVVTINDHHQARMGIPLIVERDLGWTPVRFGTIEAVRR